MRFIRRVPFTLFMEAAVLLLAAINGAATGELSALQQHRWGFGLHALWEGRLYTVFTAPVLVRDLRMLLGILVFLLCSIGVHEWLGGTREAFAVYWITNMLGLCLAAMLFVGPLYLARTAMGLEWAYRSDVGPSAGGLGSIGAWVRRLPGRYRRWLFVAMMTYLIAKLVLVPELFADSAHLIAFPLGYALQPVLARALARGSFGRNSRAD
jgi:hypothetical protein